MKKLYIAGLYADNENNKKIAAELESFGLQNSTRWMLRSSVQKPYTLENLSESLAENLEDMRNADVYLFLPQKATTARGCYVEFGYMLAQVEAHPERIIYLIADEDPAFHWFHPNVKIFKTLPELVAYLQS